MIRRGISETLLNASKSVLLLGPRQVGKSTLISHLQPELTIQLADEVEFLRYASIPQAFKEDVIQSGAKSVFVDEIQRLPNLLNTIQVMIDSDPKRKFLLTGSSARKLKRGQANLLPGRIFQFSLGPLVASELNYEMETQQALETGTLPGVYLSTQPQERSRVLKSYSAIYLKEEIKAEAIVRQLDAFSRFLQEVSIEVGQFVDFTKLARRAKVSRHGIPRYFEILEDTLIGYRVFPVQDVDEDVSLIKHPKFYLFDNGVYNGLLGNFVASADRVGTLAEQLVYSQLLHSAWACEKNIQISTFRTRGGAEVDFVVDLEGDRFGVEVKASGDVYSDELEGLRLLSKVSKRKVQKSWVLHMGTQERKFGDIHVLPWQKGLREMGL